MSADLNTILQTMIASQGQGMNAVARQALLSQFAEDDPTLNLLTTYLSQTTAPPSDETPADEEHAKEAADCAAELARARARSEQTAEAVQELRDRIQELFAELETLRARNDALAQALGTCALCWGEDVECPICGGDGQPGFIAPDQRMFAQMIGPAIDRIRKRNTGEREFSATGSRPPDVTH